MNPAGPDFACTFAPKEAPATTSEKEPKRVQATIIILGIHCYLIIKQHAYKIERCYKAMPQTPKKSIGMSGQTLFNGFIISAS